MLRFTRNKLGNAIAISMLASSTTFAGGALAQDSQAEEETIELISISRKRPESLQQVPIAVSALSARDIETAGIERPGDFISLVPNVNIVDTANVGDTQVNIRGIVSTRDAESTFAYVVDGVLMTNPNGFNGELLDIAQIEILKGPQGALYGRNAVAGAILVTTTLPSDELEGSVKVAVGNAGAQRINGIISGGLSETVRGRITASYNTIDGHYENIFTGEDSVDFLEDTTLKGRLMWDVSEDLTLDMRAGVSSVKGGAINFNAVFALPSFVEAFNQPAYNADVNDHDFIFAFNVPGENEQDSTELSIKADWDLDGYDVTGVLSYNDLEETLLSDGTSASFYGYELTPQCQTDRATLNNTPTALGGADRTDLFGEFFAPFGIFPPGVEFTGVYGPYTPSSCDGYQYQERSQSDFSGELRVTSDDDSADLRWIAGLYFAEIDRDVVVAYGADQGQGFLRQSYVPASGPNPTDLLFDDTYDTSVLSAFGQVEYDVSEKLEVSVALRYDHEDRTVSNNVPYVTASGLNINTIVDGEVGLINPGLAGNPDGIPDRSRSFAQFQPKVTLSYELSDNVNSYASYGVGFRSGGFNSLGTQATLDFWFNSSGTGNPGDAVDAQLLVTDDYDKEVTTNIELGIKSKLLDNKVRLNAAVFKTNVEDNQFFEFFAGPFGLLRAVSTIDELEIQGFELDVTADITESFKVFAGLGLLDSEIKENRSRPITVGNKAPQSPDTTYTLGFSYEKPINDEFWVTTRVDYQYTGETYFHTLQGEETPTIWDFFGTLGGGVPPGPHSQNFNNAKRDSFFTVNARIALEADNWTLAIYGKNITDEEYLQEVIPAPEFGGSFIHPSALAEYGVEFAYNF
ncbi:MULTISPECIES: TonB-dependent receptor [Aliiglaciecola]|uniref:TonB-dependent receptor n=1 Tax=Aliiglaciecola TaxID=1406885 RepID=UPI001C08D6F2|nr:MULTISPECIES: TonB-dependent receptor [Aliiglaciecola]MBU2876065.1 TonB-dependent receptor [Aliiglaciecola lipolytica]MDO6713149.1 TonB-dependent receptor [Aliiglaciecola sp. 2_MG-2023]MDO6754177.1 TonB-dependent receptor [Aliiglaciecola sp. 1_MG-2023]